MREYAFGIFLMSLGVMLNILYWVTELFIRKKTPYEDFMEDPVAHALIILLIPIMAVVGYQFLQERKLRAQVEEARLKAEQSREKLQEFFRELEGIMHTVPAAVLTTNGDGLINFFNRRAMEYLKRSEREILGTPIWGYFLEPEVGETIRKMLKGELKEKMVTLEATLHTGKAVQLSISAVPGGDGKVEGVGVVASLLDITKLKRLLEELEETNRYKNLFLDILRHDLLNPAGVIDNYVDLMLEDAREGEKEDLLAMKRAVKKILGIIDDAAKLARLEKIKLEFKDIDLDSVIREVIEDLRPMLEKAGMQVEYASRGSLPIRASPLLYDVFANLLSNAIKYARDGRRVVIEVEDEGENYIIRVKDFGEGVADEFKESIFERFKRKEKRGVKGTGLGLAIVKRIVEMHSGRVWVEDNSPRGAVFVVMLPKHRES
jgi:PAS domain S-box-containing protein